MNESSLRIHPSAVVLGRHISRDDGTCLDPGAR